MHELRKGVTLRFFALFAIAGIAIAGIAFVESANYRALYQPDFGATTIIRLLFFLVIFVHYLPFAIIAGYFNAYAHITNADLNGVDGDEVFLYQASQPAVITSIVVVLLYVFVAFFLTPNIAKTCDNIYVSTLMKEYDTYTKRYTYLLTSRGNEHLAEGNARDALAYFNQAIYYDDDYLPALEGYAKAHEEGRTNAVPKEARTHLREGLRLYVKGAYEEALAHFTETLSLDPNNVEATYYRKLIAYIITNKKAQQGADEFTFLREQMSADDIAHYRDEDNKDILSYERRKQGMRFYEKGDLFSAYTVFLQLHKEFPHSRDINNHFRLVKGEVRRLNFFLRDAERVYEGVIQRKGLYNPSRPSLQEAVDSAMLGDIPLGDDALKDFTATDTHVAEGTLSSRAFFLIGNDTYCFADNVFYYNDTLFLFDLVLFKPDETFAPKASAFFRYGKVMEYEEGEDRLVRLVLKGRVRDGVISKDEHDFYAYALSAPKEFYYYLAKPPALWRFIPFGTLIDIYRARYPEKTGYDETPVRASAVESVFHPLFFFFLLALVTYLSLRFRLAYDGRAHTFHLVFGGGGVLLFLFMTYKAFFYLLAVIVGVTASLIPYLVLAFILIALTIFFSIQTALFRLEA